MYLLFDIGGTKTRLAVGKKGGKIGDPIIIPSQQNYNLQIKTIASNVKKLGGENFKAVMVGVAGTLNAQKTALASYRNMPDWVGKPLKTDLEKITGAQVKLENDANLAGLGEAVFGAGKDKRIVAYITVSSGVGGVRIVDQKIDRSASGFEPGFQIVNIGSDDNNKLNNKYGNSAGYLQRLVGGLDLAIKHGKEPKEIRDEGVWDEVARNLAIGLNNTIVHWSPGVVVLGGGLINSGKIKFNKLTNYLDDYLVVFRKKPQVLLGELGDKAGLYGALAAVSKAGA